jgi:glycosyltransferase involved in cell wall biosynthesis
MSDARLKRILLLDIGAPFGGVETYILGLADILNSEAKVYAVCGLIELAEGFRARNVEVIRIPIVGSRISNLIRFVVTALILPFVILRYRIDTVQVNGYLESMLVLPARILGCFAIRTAHGPSEIELYRWYKQPTKYFTRFFALQCLNMASRIVCVSETVGREILRRVPARKVVVIPNWVPKMPISGLHKETLSSPVNLLYVGRLEQYKGLQFVLEAMRGLAGVRLTVVGVGAYRPELEKLAEGLDVSFEGFCSNTDPFYQSADIFINPSLGPEGLPIVSLESMAHGLPCVFSALPVHKEISNNGAATLLFEPGNVDDLREKLSQLVADPALRSQLSRNARAVVEQRYSPDAARKAYLNAFELKGAY